MNIKIQERKKQKGERRVGNKKMNIQGKYYMLTTKLETRMEHLKTMIDPESFRVPSTLNTGMGLDSLQVVGWLV